MAEHKIPVLSLTIANFNPNHKYRVLLVPSLYWLADLAFAGRDDSIYIAPRLQKAYTLTGHGFDGNLFTIPLKPSQDLHFSLHHSGTVNLTAADRRIKIRQQPINAFHGRLLTLGIRNPQGLQCATEDEVNTLPRRFSVLSVFGFLDLSPVYLTIFRVPAGRPWEIPKLSDTLQTHFECLLRGKDVKYEYVVWQNAAIASWPGDVAISF